LDTSTLPRHDVLLPHPPAAIGPAHLAGALIKAVSAPDSAPPLAALAARAGSACIVVSDKTRNYGQALLLPPLLDHLNEAGMADERITVLIGNGTHENHSDKEKAALLGEDVLRRVRVSDHDADDPDANISLGATPAGTPVMLNRMLMDADLKIITGGVTHHYYAGFTGGRKGIMPGCAARATIEANHSRVLQADGTPHPRAAAGVLHGNPVHEDMLAAARMVDNVFLINAVTGDHGAPAALFAGDLEAAHAQAAALARACYEVPIEKQYDCVIASCGGAPRDMSFYQAHKSYNNAFAACRPGGAIILVAECAAGLGPQGFADWFALKSPWAIAQKLRARYAVPGQTAMATLRKAAAARTILVSALPPALVRLMNMAHADSLETALAMHGREPGAAAVMPQAAYTVPALGA
jgi:nickel-dependent lactate racemase